MIFSLLDAIDTVINIDIQMDHPGFLAFARCSFFLSLTVMLHLSTIIQVVCICVFLCYFYDLVATLIILINMSTIFDILNKTSPCFSGKSLVKTETGDKFAEDIRKDDKVFSLQRDWVSVINNVQTGTTD